MNTNLTFDATGYSDGVASVLSGFESMVDSYFNTENLAPLVALITGAVVIVGIWYGVRAILRAMRTPR